MGKATTRRRPPSCPHRFSRSELRKLERLFQEMKFDLLDEKLHQKLVDEFNRAPWRAGEKALKVEDVQRWFSCKKEDLASKVMSSPADLEVVVVVPDTPPAGSKDMVVVPDASLSNNAPESSSDAPKGQKIPEVTELKFEARSANGAWYDVAAFLSYRFLKNDKVEVHVRYENFGAEDDEWVNLREEVRVRSIPLESSGCTKVAVGDRVVCFRETSELSAAYYDAHVMEIQRKLHDIRGCRCLFLIRYNLDQAEERVPLRRLCGRPSAKW